MKTHDQQHQLPPLGTRERLNHERYELDKARATGEAGRISIAHACVDTAGQAWLRAVNGEAPPVTEEPPLAYAYARSSDVTPPDNHNGLHVELTKTLPESPHLVAIVAALNAMQDARHSSQPFAAA